MRDVWIMRGLAFMCLSIGLASLTVWADGPLWWFHQFIVGPLNLLVALRNAVLAERWAAR